MKIISQFFAAIRRLKFNNKIQREIESKIFPQIKGRAENGYPFSTSGGIHKRRLEVSMQLWEQLRELDSAGLNMSDDDECNAFLYVAYRDLDDRVKAYLEYARARKGFRVPNELQLAAKAA